MGAGAGRAGARGNKSRTTIVLTLEERQVRGGDPLDELFKQHDLDYEKARNYSPTDKAVAILQADLKLLNSMNSLMFFPNLLDVYGLAYRQAATQAFIAKSLWDVGNIARSKLPDFPDNGEECPMRPTTSAIQSIIKVPTKWKLTH